MAAERIDERLLIDYLLGSLTEDQESRVEDRAFADADYLAALEDAEADLIDAYVRGRLSRSERSAFERRFLVSPNRHKKVQFALALAKVAAESAAPGDSPRGWELFLRFVQGWTPALRFAVACSALVVICGVGWLVVQNATMRSRLAAAERRNQAASQELEKRATAGPAVGQIPALVLLPGVSRAVARAEQLALPPSAPLAHIDVQLEPRDEYPGFRAELRTRSGQDVLARANLQPERKGGARVVSLDVPSSALPPGDYELSLKGVRADGTSTDVGYYYFTVSRP